MLKAVILLFSIIASINSGVVRKIRSDDLTLLEIMNTLQRITEMQRSEAACHETMVLDVFSDMTNQGVSETYCKAAKALKNITPCKLIQHYMENLQVNLLKVGENTPTCTVDIDSEIELRTFLKNLMKFSKITYSQS